MRHLLLIVLSLASVLLMSMAERTEMPPELRNIKALVKDSKGLSHQLNSLRCGDGTSLKFKKGSLTYSLPLSSIKSLEVLNREGDYVKAKVKLQDDSSEIFYIYSGTRCSARSKVGSVNFYINEVRKIELFKGESR